MATFGLFYPFPLVNREEAAEIARGNYVSDLDAAYQYEPGDLVTLRAITNNRAGGTLSTVAGDVSKEIGATAANIASAGALAVVGQPHDLSPLDTARYSYITDNGVPMNKIRPEEEWVMTMEDTVDAALVGAIRAGTEYEISLATIGTTDALTVKSTTTNPSVKAVRIFKGEIGDVNPLVVVKFLSAAVL